MLQNTNKMYKRRRTHRVLWITVGSVLIIILIFFVLVFFIVQNQGIMQGLTTITIISIILGVVISLLGLMFTFFQWFYPLSPGQHTSSPTSAQSDVLPPDKKENLLSPTSATGFVNKKAITPLLSPPEDWEEAYQIGNFFGREQELADITQWVIDEHCKIAILLGVGGVGKTALAVKALQRVKPQFQYVFGRSLQNAPPLETVLNDCIQLLSDHSQLDLPDTFDAKLALFIEYLREKRCLIVLDNFETILQPGNITGNYREGYGEYRRLLQYISTFKHQSCLLLTSREKPKEIVQSEGPTGTIHILTLSGLGQLEGQAVLKDRGLFGSEDAWSTLIRLYSGNPLALKLAAEPIRELFGGDISEFLKDGEIVVSNVYDLLDQQFNRLSRLECEVAYWLAVEREAISFNDLQKSIVHSMPKRSLIKTLESLLQRSIAEKNSKNFFMLQPVIMEYVTDRFVGIIYKEVETESIDMFGSYALIKAQAKDYVRESQFRLILTPIAKLLLSTLGRKMSEQKLKNVLSALHTNYSQVSNYAAGNLLNLLIHLKMNLRGYDFSHLIVRQAYLINANLPDVNFSYANLATCVFTDTFGSILSIAFSTDGNLLAAGTSKGEIHVWEISSGTPLYTCQGHTDWVRSVAFSPDSNSKLLASGSEDCTVRFWGIDTGQCLKILQGHTRRIWSVAFSLNGEFLASGSDDLTIRLWNVSTQIAFNILEGHTNWVRSVTFHPHENILISGSGDLTVKLWDITTGTCLKTLQGHDDLVYSVACNPNGKIIASGSGDLTVKLWDITTGTCLKTLQGHSSWIYSVKFSPDGNIVASSSDDQTIRLWDVYTGQCLKTLRGHIQWVRSVIFHPDGEVLASGSADQTIRLWDAHTGQCLKTLQGYSDSVYSIAISPNNNLLLSGGDDNAVRVWDIVAGQCLKTLQGHKGWIYSVKFSPDGNIVASSSDDQTIRLWDAHTGQCLKTLRGHTHWVRSVIFHPDEEILASSADDQTIRLWDVHTGQCLKTLHGHSSWVYSVAFSPDGQTLASGSDDQTVRLWDVHTGQCLKTLHGHTKRVWSVAFSPDGQTLASGSADQTVRLWNTVTGEYLQTLLGHTDWVRTVAFSPNKNIIASGSGDHTVKLWDITTSTCLRTLYGHQNRVYSVAFSSIENILASTGEDGTMRIWDVLTGEQLKMLRNEKQYERMNITETEGLTSAQVTSLKILGAISNEHKGALRVYE